MKVASEINTVELTVPNEYEEDTDETVYTASDRREGEPVQTAEYENAAAADDALAGGFCGFISADCPTSSRSEATRRKSLRISSPFRTPTAVGRMY